MYSRSLLRMLLTCVTLVVLNGCGCNRTPPSHDSGGQPAAATSVPSKPSLQEENERRGRIASWNYMLEVIKTLRRDKSMKLDATNLDSLLLYAAELEKVPEVDVALECLKWTSRWIAQLEKYANYRQLTDEQR